MKIALESASPFDICHLVFCYLKRDLWVLDKLAEHLQGQDRDLPSSSTGLFPEEESGSFFSVCIG